MTKQEELKISIAQNKTDQGRLQAEAEQLQSELSALAKPELRHGDYGLSAKGNRPRLYVYDNGIRWANKSYLDDHEWTGENLILGNIFDDLAALSEPLEEFGVDGKGKSTPSHLTVQTEYGSCISFKTRNNGGPWFWATLDEATEIAHKILRAVATAKRKAKE